MRATVPVRSARPSGDSRATIPCRDVPSPTSRRSIRSRRFGFFDAELLHHALHPLGRPAGADFGQVIQPLADRFDKRRVGRIEVDGNQDELVPAKGLGEFEVLAAGLRGLRQPDFEVVVRPHLVGDVQNDRQRESEREQQIAMVPIKKCCQDFDLILAKRRSSRRLFFVTRTDPAEGPPRRGTIHQAAAVRSFVPASTFSIRASIRSTYISRRVWASSAE